MSESSFLRSFAVSGIRRFDPLVTLQPMVNAIMILPLQITFRHMEPSLDAKLGFGRIETDDGRLIYFHQNSVLGGRFPNLKTGTQVRFAEEAGDRGPQASSVHVIS